MIFLESVCSEKNNLLMNCKYRNKQKQNMNESTNVKDAFPTEKYKLYGSSKLCRILLEQVQQGTKSSIREKSMTMDFKYDKGSASLDRDNSLIRRRALSSIWDSKKQV